ncbi:ABC transporter permease [Synechococcus sp. PCC 6312]|uniref:ABC transporter permease n=1 Tax=Synechococcus sp. (strain ATCC 27167 / PCC 6312) TaxID=195253 RepID=UPI00029F1BE9|nr:ABC transporter permease [Synechococcus sp. PCC 6312]AFY59912.1 ABC-type antimicrobial peptide transport system, permease component [Synechococcus sp. PCC 6312]
MSSRNWIFLRLALQNLGRRKTRTLLLIGAVAVATGAIFAITTLLWGVQSSMIVGFSRLGADLLVVPQGTLVNITSALLTAAPTDLTLDSSLASEIATIPGVSQVAPQLIVRTDQSGYHWPGDMNHPVDLIAFDPGHDFTVKPWLVEQLSRPFQTGDVIVGGGHSEQLNQELYLYGQRLIVYGRLAPTGVGTHEQGLFVDFETLQHLSEASQTGKNPLQNQPGQYSGLLVKLKPGATSQQVQFAILAQAPQVKVIIGAAILTTVRQGLTALLGGILLLMLGMLVGLALMISVIFSAIVSERQQELGLLAAIGTKPGPLIGLVLLEATLMTGLGGFIGTGLGLGLIRLSQRTLIYDLNSLGVSFLWPGAWAMAALGLSCILGAALLGGLGALVPAWKMSRHDPYELIG